MMDCHPERSEGSLDPLYRASVRNGQALVVRGTRCFASLSMTGKYGVEYGDRTVPMSEAARRAVEKLAKAR
jgi:hypothetical protein